MTESASITQNNSSTPSPLVLSRFLRPELVVSGLEVSSRKRLFEEFARLISSQAQFIHCDDKPSVEKIFSALHDRERLGCTALGKGIALPHGRMPGLQEPLVSIARLKQPLDYDAPDGGLVWLAVCLLVPEDATELHLNILGALAARFDQNEFVNAVKIAEDRDALHALFSHMW